MNRFIISEDKIHIIILWLWGFFFLAHSILRADYSAAQRLSVLLIIIFTVLHFLISNFRGDLIFTVKRLPWFSIVYGFFVLDLFLSQKYGIIYNPDNGVRFYSQSFNLPALLCMEIYFNSRKKTVDLLQVFSIAMTITAVMTTATTPIGYWGQAQGYGGMGHLQRNLASMMYVIAFGVCMFLITEKKNLKLNYGCAIVLFITNLITGSRKGIIQVVSVIALYLLLQGSFKDKLKYIKYIVIVGVIFLLVFLNSPWLQETFGERMLAVFDDSIADTSKEYRTIYRTLAFLWFLDHPVFGYGYHAFPLMNETVTGMVGAYSHCNYTDLLCNYGLVGFFIYYLNYIISYIKGFKNVKDNLGKFVLYTALPVLLIEYGQIDYYITCGFIAAMIPLFAVRNVNR